MEGNVKGVCGDGDGCLYKFEEERRKEGRDGGEEKQE